VIPEILIENPLNLVSGWTHGLKFHRKGLFVMPLEIDVHFKSSTYEPWDVEYDLLGYCDLCNFRIDGFGYCAYGGSAD
jgi:hypothetical protein